ncbi:hypothetical protein J4437_00205 [Candidatus Woesearchaeota archaeon]|nr:hypothetical protein [Candidatus Woesearchaeota archaeon]
MFKTISFYRYTEIKNPEELKLLLIDFAKRKSILGRILLGKEGINGAVSGRENSIEEIKIFLQETFEGLTFREQEVKQNSYHKLVVKIRNEVCVFGENVNLTNTADHLSPKDLNKWYKENKNFTIVDARNDYEFDVGHFKNAIKMPIRTFKQFAAASRLLEKKKKETIVLYCTGGVRCEKASAYLKEQGFKDVHQVEGGIINYTNQFKDYWEGSLFVFDDRLVEENSSNINHCSFCKKKSDKYYNCHNLDCDKLFIACDSCIKPMNTCCSKSCRESPRQRKELRKVSPEIIGVVDNYYPKIKVASIFMTKNMLKDEKITFFGKTTHFSQIVEDFKKDEEGFITLQVREKVRKNDKVALGVY